MAQNKGLMLGIAAAAVAGVLLLGGKQSHAAGAPAVAPQTKDRDAILGYLNKAITSGDKVEADRWMTAARASGKFTSSELASLQGAVNKIGTAKPAATQPTSPPPDIISIMTTALATSDPAKIEAAAQVLAAKGWPTQAAELDNAARILREKIAAAAAAAAAGAPVTSPGIPQPPGYGPPKGNVTIGPVTVMPIPSVSKEKELALQVARDMTGMSPYKETAAQKATVKAYQLQEGLKADGKYGPGTAGTMLKYDLVPPTPVYWPAAPKTRAAITAYRKVLEAKAAADPARRGEWLGAAGALP